MTRYLQSFCLCSIVVLLSACVTSAKTQFYTLSKPLNTSSANTETIQSISQLTSISVNVPDRLKRPQLVLNTPDGTGVLMLEHDRWVSTFDDELHDAISSGIHQQILLNNKQSTAQTMQAHYRINVSLLQMDTLLNDHVTANFRWSIVNRDKSANDSSEAKLSCDFNANKNIQDGVRGAVKGTQAIVQELVNAIVERMQKINAGETAAC
jgi:uncharacterized lipoprotein YmbA